MEKYKLVIFTFFLIFIACDNKVVNNSTKVTVNIDFAYHQKIYLQRQPFNDEKLVKMDSAVPQKGRDTLTFYIPAGTQQRLYSIAVAGSSIQIPFINDAKDIGVYYNYSTKKVAFKNSPASQQLKVFREQQFALAVKMRKLKQGIDSMLAHHAPRTTVTDSTNKLNALSMEFFGRYKSFADTVNSPAAFLAVYDAVEFGNDTAASRKFVVAAAARFSKDTSIQALSKNVLDYLNAIGNRYKPGDMLPELVLPDQYGVNFSTYSLKGKYVLLNIWASLCDDCLPYAEAARAAKQHFSADKFEVVSVALDDHKNMWLGAVAQHNYNWPQLIDDKMWNGPAFKALRFDSIPYNFLVGPDGRLLAKGIKSDSIMQVAARFVK